MAEPTPPFDVTAIAAYSARNEAEVSLEVGRTYSVIQTDGKGLWWQTRGPNGNIGWFPASYTQVVQARAPPPVAHAPTPAQTLQPNPQPQALASLQAQSSSNLYTPRVDLSPASASSPSLSTNGAKDSPPAPSRPVQKEKTETPVYVSIQIVEAKGFKGDPNKLSPTVFIYRRVIMDPGPGELVHKTGTMKKAGNPRWNELFQINVQDAESEIVSIRVANGKKFKPKGKEYLGEVNIPLRGAARASFEKPNHDFKWYPLKGNKLVPDAEVTGELLVYIQYVDTRQSQGPSNFQHTSHVGWTADGGFDVNNIPAEWKQVFRSVGLRKQDLVNNPNLAKDVLNIMNNNADQQAAAAHQQQTHQPQTSAPVAPQPPAISSFNAGGSSSGPSGYSAPPMASDSGRPPAPPPQQSMFAARQPEPAPVASVPTPPPMSTGGPPAPPPPPPAGGGASSGGGPPPPPPPAVTPASNEGRGGLLADINKGGFQLKRVDTDAQQKPPPSSGGGTLADTLKAAMINHRKDIEGNDDGGEDWSDDWD